MPNSNNKLESEQTQIQKNELKNITAKKWTKKRTLQLFSILATITMAIGLTGIIYSIVSNSSYLDNDPWANATPLDSKISSDINSALWKTYSDDNDDISDFVRFYVNENSGFESYVGNNGIDKIRKQFRKLDWIDNNLSAVNKLLEGTGAKLNGNQVSYKGEDGYHLLLLPRILRYPYNGTDDVYGYVNFVTDQAGKGMLKFNIRFLLELSLWNGGSNYTSLKKQFIFEYHTLDYISISKILLLANNSEVSRFIDYSKLNTKTNNAQLLEMLLAYYYKLSSNDRLNFEREIKDDNGTPFAQSLDVNNIINDHKINVSYDSRLFNNLDQFGANLLNGSQNNNFAKMSNILSTLGVAMPRFENVGEFKAYNRGQRYNPAPDNTKTIFNQPMTNEMVNSYQGYVNDFLASDDVSDYNSRHVIFFNEVKVNFLDTNREPTYLYYDQLPYEGKTINLNEFDMDQRFTDISLDYDNTTATQVDAEIQSRFAGIENELRNLMAKQLGITTGQLSNVLKDIKIQIKPGDQTAINFEPPINGMNRSNPDLLFQDKKFVLPAIDVRVDLIGNPTKSLSADNIKTYNAEYQLTSRIVSDPHGIEKLAIDDHTFSITKNLTTAISERQGIIEVENQIIDNADEFIDHNPFIKLSNDKYPDLDNELIMYKPKRYNPNYEFKNDFELISTARPSSRDNLGNLKVGTYSYQLKARNSSWYFRGETSPSVININVNKADITGDDLYKGYQTNEPYYNRIDTLNKGDEIYNKVSRDFINKIREKGIAINESDFTLSINGVNNDDALVKSGDYNYHIAASPNALFKGSYNGTLKINKFSLSMIAEKIHIERISTLDYSSKPVRPNTGDVIIREAKQKAVAQLQNLGYDSIGNVKITEINIGNYISFSLIGSSGEVVNPGDPLLGGSYRMKLEAKSGRDIPFTDEGYIYIDVRYASFDDVFSDLKNFGSEYKNNWSTKTYQELEGFYKNQITECIKKFHWSMRYVHYDISIYVNGEPVNDKSEKLKSGKYEIILNFYRNTSYFTGDYKRIDFELAN